MFCKPRVLPPLGSVAAAGGGRGHWVIRCGAQGPLGSHQPERLISILPPPPLNSFFISWTSEVLFAVVFHGQDHLASDTGWDRERLSEFGKEEQRKKEKRERGWSTMGVAGHRWRTGLPRKSPAPGREHLNPKKPTRGMTTGQTGPPRVERLYTSLQSSREGGRTRIEVDSVCIQACHRLSQISVLKQKPFSLPTLCQQKLSQGKGICETLSLLFLGGWGGRRRRHKVKYLHIVFEDYNTTEQLSQEMNQNEPKWGRSGTEGPTWRTKGGEWNCFCLMYTL